MQLSNGILSHEPVFCGNLSLWLAGLIYCRWAYCASIDFDLFGTQGLFELQSRLQKEL